MQNTSLYETRGGALVFAAATFHWCLALVDSPYTDVRIQTATTNLLHRMRAGAYAAFRQAFAAAFISRLYARTLSSDAPSTMSATDRNEPSSP